MRQTFLQSTLLLTMMALLLGSCSDKEDVLQLDDSGALTFNASVGRSGITRGTLDGTFDGDEKIAVTMRAVDASDWPVVRRYVANTSGQLTHSADLAANAADVGMWRWPKNADAIEVKGWYTADQYRTAVDGEEFGVPVDQSGGRSVIQGYDFLFAPATTANDRTNASVKLDMWHQLCLVVISIENDENLYDEDVINSVRMFGTQWAQRATYTEPTGTGKLFGAWTPGTAFTEGVKPLLQSHSEDGKALIFEAMVVPQQTRGRQLISFDLSGIHYTYTLPTAEEDSPDFLPGMVYYYHLRLPDKQLMVTADLWDYEPHITFDSPVNPWQDLDKSATYVKVTEWIRANHDDNKVTPEPWLPDNIPFNAKFWIVDWLNEDTTGVIDYIKLRQATDRDTIPVPRTNKLKYGNGWFIYAGGSSTAYVTIIGGGFAPPAYSTRKEGYINWAILSWEHSRTSLQVGNVNAQGPWAFRIDDNNRLRGKAINALRLTSASGGTEKKIKLYVKNLYESFERNETPDAVATISAQAAGQVVIAKFKDPITHNDKTLTLDYMKFLVIDAPDNTFKLDDNFDELFYCNANTSSWPLAGASLGIDVGYIEAPVTDNVGTWYITSYTDNADNLTDSRTAAAAPFAGYVYPPTMQARLWGHEFNAFRFKCNVPGSSFKVYAIQRSGINRTELGTVTVPSTAQSGDVVTCYLMNNNNAPVSYTLQDDQNLVIDGGLSNFYSATGGTFSDYMTGGTDHSYYLFGPEGYYTIASTNYWGNWAWEPYGLLGVDVGYVTPPAP